MLHRCIVLFITGVVALATGCTSKTSGTAALSPDQRYQLVSESIPQMDRGGRISRVHWSDDCTSFTFTRAGERIRYDIVTGSFATVEQQSESDAETPRRRRGGDRPARGRQRERAVSPDGEWVAICRDWSVVIESNQSSNEQAADAGAKEETSQSDSAAIEPIPVTTDGTRKLRYGSASWVYGEELDQTDAMWWSPDSRKLVFYEFDERNVPDHFLTAGLTDLHTRVQTEGYPKPGEPNPVANLLVYDLESRQTIRIDPQEDDDDWYTYRVQFTPGKDNSVLLFHRTNRRQNVLHLIAADLDTGRTRTVLTETQETWQDNSPTLRFLADGKRFIWATEKSGYKQFELRDLDGTLISTLTRGDYPVASIVRVDEEAGELYYTAYHNPPFVPCAGLHAQLFRVKLDGTDQRCLTWSDTTNSVEFSPDGRYFIATQESIDEPPRTILYDRDGNILELLTISDLSKFRDMNMTMPEPFQFKADDGVTDIYGVLYKPSNFDPRKKYPLLIDVYGGPLSQSVRARFLPARAECEYGILIAQIDNRGTINRGKVFESAAYLKLGDVDLKDQADAVRYLSRRTYVDSTRVGITGHSYGGYMSALALLKYPDLFHVAVAGGTVSDWRNYDTIYTERFMRTPQENPEGYDNGSCMKYAHQLKGKLLLLHGMLDDNVHPNNAWQLLEALHKAEKWQNVEIMFFPNAGHSLGVQANRYRWAFLRKHLLN